VIITRRDFVAGTAAMALASTALSALDLRFIGTAQAQSPSQADLAVPGALGDIVEGKDDAPVTIIEYASMTCSHCATFHQTTYPTLKSKYIDTGKVKYIMREFPLDPLAAGAFMLARCAGKDKYHAMLEILFQKQKDWVVQKPIEPLLAIAKQPGFTEQSFNACLQDQKLLEGIEATRTRAAEKLGVNSTPTFFINGKVFRGAMTVEDLEKEIAPHLKS
jgi:protein-disulfide isomerase